jgi:CPA2 family monovalent cation:H+ antiporter-2
VWWLINRRADRRVQAYNQRVNVTLARSTSPLAVVLGYGPVGRTVDELLRSHGFETLVVDLNMDTIQNLTRQGRLGIYGDAYNIEVVAQSLPRATHLVIAIPHAANREALIASAKLINPTIKVFVRARYLAEREELRQVGADYVCYEEAEAAAALARGVLQDQGVPEDTIRRVTLRIRQQYGVVRQS